MGLNLEQHVPDDDVRWNTATFATVVNWRHGYRYSCQG